MLSGSPYLTDLIDGSMKLLIIGGTGKTGRELIRQGLEKGHRITALVRNPAALQIASPNLSVIQGDVLVADQLTRAVQGQDAVLSALGHKRFFLPSSRLSAGTRNILDAMEQHGVKRLICITSMGIRDNRFRLGLYYTLFVIPVIVGFYFMDKARQEKLIEDSRLDWTIVRPGQLTIGKKRENIKHGANLGHYIFTHMISRASVAGFMLGLLEDTRYRNRAVSVTN